ncbi:hypothetical protein BaRGS_00022827 [Batillaria attramentaria]|uniref:Uncharacterized protein n=1 Tax=Batillaria attramentaria TaxID=370345 RepID=A0ABD0KG70_9CAEN
MEAGPSCDGSSALPLTWRRCPQNEIVILASPATNPMHTPPFSLFSPPALLSHIHRPTNAAPPEPSEMRLSQRGVPVSAASQDAISDAGGSGVETISNDKERLTAVRGSTTKTAGHLKHMASSNSCHGEETEIADASTESGRPCDGVTRLGTRRLSVYRCLKTVSSRSLFGE